MVLSSVRAGTSRTGAAVTRRSTQLDRRCENWEAVIAAKATKLTAKAIGELIDELK
jgi:hypothetical protein